MRSPIFHAKVLHYALSTKFFNNAYEVLSFIRHWMEKSFKNHKFLFKYRPFNFPLTPLSLPELSKLKRKLNN